MIVTTSGLNVSHVVKASSDQTLCEDGLEFKKMQQSGHTSIGSLMFSEDWSFYSASHVLFNIEHVLHDIAVHDL